jgi:hypothetical protein
VQVLAGESVPPLLLGQALTTAMEALMGSTSLPASEP